MQNLNKILGLIIIAASVLTWLYIEQIKSDTPANDPIENETTADNPKKPRKKPDTPAFEPVKTDTKIKSTVDTQKNIPIKEETSNNKKENCISQQAFDQDPRHQIINQFIKNEYLKTEIDYINYLDNQELTKLAKQGNLKAMYILGMNLRWNAVYHGNRAERFRPQEIEKQPINPRDTFNHASWQQALYWLERAAARGQISALIDIAIGYQHQAYLLEEQGEVEEKNIVELKQKALAFIQLHQQLAPQLSDPHSIKSLTDELPEPHPQLLEKLKRRWKKEREALGLSEQLELNIPAEIDELKTLSETICQPTHKE